MQIRPGLVWQVGGNVAVVVDAKYITGEKPENIYQILAYCVALVPRRDHLVYAKGNGTPARYVVRQAGIEIVCHALDLTKQAADLRR